MSKRLMKELAAQQDRNRAHGYMHIPKTGSSSVGDFFHQVATTEPGAQSPVTFGHPWSARQILATVPGVRLHFVIRDPIERMMSGFLSRRRMGQPRNFNKWSSEEAITFLFFEEPEDFLRGLISDDERLFSAATFACHRVRHFRRNYVHYFESVEYLEKIGPHIGVVEEIRDMNRFLDRVCEQAGLDAALVERHYKRMHASQQSVSAIKAAMDPAEIARIEEVLKVDYAVYRHLQTFVGG